MAETKQISATINISLHNYIEEEAEKEKRTKSQMIELLLEEGKLSREITKQDNNIKSKKQR